MVLRIRSAHPKFGVLLAVACCVAAGPAAGASVAQSPEAAAAKLNRLLSDLPEKQVVCSAKVVDLTAGKVLLDLDPDRKMIPASNQKLWILAAAVAELGESFAFQTVLGARDGQVYVVGGGDPGFGDPRLVEARGESVTGELERWASVLSARGFSDLGGRLSFDDSVFDRQWTHPSWEARDLPKAYAAPVSAFSVNDNCVDTTLRPAKKPGDPVLWSMVPANDAVEIENRCLSGGKGEPIIHRPGLEMRLVISGRCSRDWNFPPVAVSDPVALFAGTFRRVLAERGIEIDSGVRTGRARLADGGLPPDLAILARYETPLAPVLARIGKNSQNLFAESLLKRLGFEWARRTGLAHPVGSWDTGRRAVVDFARGAGISLTETDFDDASGLSRRNRISASQAVALLEHMYRHPARDLFVDSLAVAGQDGSLRKRMKGLGGTVHAKTGYLTGVRTLSGYVITPSQRWFAFSVLFNDIKGQTKPFNDLHDEICGLLATWPD